MEKKFNHTKRSFIGHFLLGIITLGIYPFLSFIFISKEIDEIEGKKGMNYGIAFLLGFITLGIVPLIWACRAARKVSEAAKKLGVRNTTGYGAMFNWNFYGILIGIGPIIAISCFLHTLNRVEAKLNEGAVVAEEPMLEATEEITPIDIPEATENTIPEAPVAEEPTAPIENEKPVITERIEEPIAKPVDEPKHFGNYKVTYKVEGVTYVRHFKSREDALAFGRQTRAEQGGKIIIKQ